MKKLGHVYERKHWSSHPFLGMVIIASCAAIIATRWLTDSEPAAASHGLRPATEVPTELEQRWGVRLLGIRLSAAGNMLDFRYRIVDAERAAPLADRKTQPYVVDEKSGSRLSVPTAPTLGVLRQTSTTPLENRIYFALFANPGKEIQVGDRVTVVMGDFRAEHLIVE